MNSYFYLAFFPLHVFLVFALFNLKQISFPMTFALWVILSGYGVGVALHRLLSHRSFETSVFTKKFLSLLACFCVQGSPLFWVNVHRGYHHKHSDKSDDLHSPIHGRFWAYWLWTCRVDPHNLSYKSVTDLLRSKYQIFLSDYYFFILWAGWFLAWFISPFFFFSLVIAQFFTLHFEFCVNLFCHVKIPFLGYRNFQTDDQSRNYWLFGLLCWGIGYHNNHHARPDEMSFAHRKFEFDPTVVLIKLIRKHEPS